MTVLGRTEVFVPASALRMLLSGLGLKCDRWTCPAAQGHSDGNELSCRKVTSIEAVQASTSPPDLNRDSVLRNIPGDVDPMDQRCRPDLSAGRSGRHVTEENESGLDASAVEALWHERSRAAEAAAEAGGRALSLAWERDRKSLEQAIDESLAEHHGLRERAHALRRHFDLHRARWEAGARWRLLEELRRGAALSPAAALREDPLWAHGRQSYIPTRGATSDGIAGCPGVYVSSSMGEVWVQGEDMFMYEETEQLQQSGHLRASHPGHMNSSDYDSSSSISGVDSARGCNYANSESVASAYEALLSDSIRKKRRFNCPNFIAPAAHANASASTDEATVVGRITTPTTTSTATTATTSDAILCGCDLLSMEHTSPGVAGGQDELLGRDGISTTAIYRNSNSACTGDSDIYDASASAMEVCADG